MRNRSTVNKLIGGGSVGAIFGLLSGAVGSLILNPPATIAVAATAACGSAILYGADCQIAKTEKDWEDHHPFESEKLHAPLFGQDFSLAAFGIATGQMMAGCIGKYMVDSLGQGLNAGSFFKNNDVSVSYKEMALTSAIGALSVLVLLRKARDWASEPQRVNEQRRAAPR